MILSWLPGRWPPRAALLLGLTGLTGLGGLGGLGGRCRGELGRTLRLFARVGGHRDAPVFMPGQSDGAATLAEPSAGRWLFGVGVQRANQHCQQHARHAVAHRERAAAARPARASGIPNNGINRLRCAYNPLQILR